MKRTLVMLASVGLLAASLGTAEASKSRRVGQPVADASVPGEASTVKITFRVDLTDRTPASRQCTLEVPRGSNGVEVLQAAVDQGCITHYRISDSRYPPPGPWPAWPASPKGRHWLRCIDAACDAHSYPGMLVPGTRWGVAWNPGRSQRYWGGGLEEYSASRGDALVADLKAYN